MRPVPSGRWTLPAAPSTALLVAGLMMPAAAETATVSTDIKAPARNLELLDLAGQPLTELSLRDGLASAFETRVTDTHQDPQGSYRVDATMTNLHRVTDSGHSAGDQIPSSAVDLDFARSPRVADIAWDQPELAELAHLSGRTSTRPTLTVDTGNAAGGHYEGTLTVTLIE